MPVTRPVEAETARPEPPVAPGGDRVRLTFLIRSLNLGGAERQLVTLARALDQSVFDIKVVSFYPGGPLRQELEDAGISTVSLDKAGRWDLPGFLARLAGELRRNKPDILHSYMGTSNMLAALLRPLLPGTRLVWGVRCSNMDLTQFDWLSRLTFRMECRLSRRADRIIANSRAGRDHYIANGFPEDRIVVIPNGIDTRRFHPNADTRDAVRADWGVDAQTRLIGLVGRIDPMKDHETFLRAAAILAGRSKDVRFVCVGDGIPALRDRLRAQASDLGLDGRLVWAGARSDMPRVYNALDLNTSSSITEGFPNVVGEAMACGVRCAVTDTGDSAWLVGDTGAVVPIRDPEALADAWDRLLTEQGISHVTSERDPRARILEHFSDEKLQQRTTSELLEQVGDRGRRR